MLRERTEGDPGKRNSGADLIGLILGEKCVNGEGSFLKFPYFPAWDPGKSLYTEIKYVFDHLVPSSLL